MTDRMRSLFTPQLIITLITVVATGAGNWYTMVAKQEGFDRRLDKIEQKMPDGGVIEQRLLALEKAVDVRSLAQMQVKLDALEKENDQLERETRLLKDYVEGRIGRMPYRPSGG